jgi:hypothetical protein
MLYREIIALCSQIHTKHINTLCGQNGEILGAFAKLRKATLSFCPSARNNSVPTGRIFIKLNLSVLSENLWQQFQFQFQFR